MAAIAATCFLCNDWDMKRIKLPPIVEAAKKRPLGVNPHSGSFIYYDDLAKGSQKIVPVEKLNHDQVLKLAVERQFTNDPKSTTVTLNGQSFTKEQLVKEMRSQTKIGRQMFDADINYLKFYLSQFPKECFET